MLVMYRVGEGVWRAMVGEGVVGDTGARIGVVVRG